MLARSLFRLTQRWRGSGALRVLDEIRDAPFQSREHARAEQLRLLQRLLGHAEVHVPYYRALFRKLGFRAADVRSVADLTSLPILTKDIIREQGDALISETADRARLYTHRSGGSTGVPLVFYHDQALVDASTAGDYRNWMQAGWTPGDMIAFFWGFNEKLDAMSRVEFELRQQLRRTYQFDPFNADEAAMAGWAATWRRIRPKIVVGYASTIGRFARWIEETKTPLSPVTGVFTTAEKLYPEQRQIIERGLGCRVFDCYGSSEIRNIASEYGEGGMRINTDFVVVEQDRSSSLGDGAYPLLLTSLREFSMPFIRYRNEDAAVLVEDSDDVDRVGFPRIDLKVSRVSDHFVMPNGRVVHGEFFTHLMYGAEGISTFQFHQRQRDVIDVWYVPSPTTPAAAKATLARVEGELRALSPDHNVRVNFNPCESIPLSRAGKHRFTRSDVGGGDPRIGPHQT